jgi:hypothetical protein
MGYTQSREAFALIKTAASLGINDRVNGTLGITVELEITYQATDFFYQILSLAQGGSSVVKTLNQTSFHMQRMVRFEFDISASVGGFPVDLVANVNSSLMTRISRKAIALPVSVSMVNWMDGLELLRWMRKSCNCSGP